MPATAGALAYLGGRPCGDDRSGSAARRCLIRGPAHDNMMDGCANVPEQRFGKRVTFYCASTGWHFTGAAPSGGFAVEEKVPKIYHPALVGLMEIPRKLPRNM